MAALEAEGNSRYVDVAGAIERASCINKQLHSELSLASVVDWLAPSFPSSQSHVANSLDDLVATNIPC